MSDHDAVLVDMSHLWLLECFRIPECLRTAALDPCWFNHLNKMKVGFSRALHALLADSLSKCYDIPHLSIQKQILLKVEGRAGRASVLRLLMRTFGWRYVFILVTFSVWLASLSLLPFLTESLFEWLAEGQERDESHTCDSSFDIHGIPLPDDACRMDVIQQALTSAGSSLAAGLGWCAVLVGSRGLSQGALGTHRASVGHGIRSLRLKATP